MSRRFVIRHFAPVLKATTVCFLLQLFNGVVSAHIQQAGINFGDTIAYQGKPVICPGGKLLLTLANLPTNAAVKWFNAASLRPVGYLPNYEVSTAGIYFATILSNGIMHTYPSLTVTAVNNPIAGFTFLTQGNCASAPVQFNDASQGKELTYLWNFGDPNAHKQNVSTVKDPSHQFIGSAGNGSQTFVVTLTVTNAGGCSATYSQKITLLQTPDTDLGGPAEQTFNNQAYFVSCSNLPTEFTFINRSKTNNTGYNIFWGDGSPQTFVKDLTSIKHIYRIGSFIMFYTVYGSNGCSKVQKYRIFVGSSPTVPFQPKVKLTACTGMPVSININNNITSSQGTIYTATFSDGTVNMYTTLPDTLMHTFKTNSISQVVNTNHRTYINAYSLIISAINPCGIASDTLAPIYVSDFPAAKLINIGYDIVCVNSKIRFKNNGGAAYSITEGISRPNKWVWKITPDTGFRLSDSSMGSDSGSKYVSKWTSGTKNLNVVFTKAGEYKLTLLTGSEQCGIDSDSRKLCVNAFPEAAFEMNTDNGCNSQVVTIKNTSNLPLCDSAQYQWAITYDNMGCTEFSENMSFTNGTTATSAEPQFVFSGPGRYTLSLINSFPKSGCSSTAFTRQIIIRSKPLVTLNLPDYIYTDQQLSPEAIIKNCFQTTPPEYKWTFAGASITTSSLPGPDSVYYRDQGRYTIILDVTNSCGTTEVSKTINLIKRPTLYIPNTFTPNNDGINDNWNITGISNEIVTVDVFNRYGIVIYHRSGSYQPWNGTDGDKKLPVGVYYYVIKTVKNNRLYKGFLTIIY
ncbi:PKD domain-containing protein [Mucilaginibacter panaciglaebae]|uniref:PKD domain-containing protein n=1 Tax=Mucilaginibacter panaciglaebae TaxID=502331 RepID=A0ABP7WEG5_9SPHI